MLVSNITISYTSLSLYDRMVLEIHLDLIRILNLYHCTKIVIEKEKKNSNTADLHKVPFMTPYADSEFNYGF